MKQMSLKIYSIDLWRGKERTHYVATTSLKDAAKLFGCTMYDLTGHGGQIDKVNGYGDLEICLANPGVVYGRDRDYAKKMPLEIVESS